MNWTKNSPQNAAKSRGPGSLTRSGAIGSLSLCLLWLAGCSQAAPQVVVQTEILRLSPPPALMEICPKPVWDGTTNGDLLMYALELQNALDGCNAKLEAQRKWAGESE